ncbi:MAG: sulfatase/phosphatase domain-containing protein [Vicinamibacteria bacterium]
MIRSTSSQSRSLLPALSILGGCAVDAVAEARPNILLINERYKYIRYRELEDMNELHDRKDDPYELRNLIHEKSSADLLPRMQADLNALLNVPPKYRN